MKSKLIILLTTCMVLSATAQNSALNAGPEKDYASAIVLTTTVNYHQNDLSLTAVPHQSKFSLTTEKLEEYLESPKQFFEKQFNFTEMVKKFAKNEYEDFQVEMVFDRGAIYATFSRDGALLETHYKFRNIRVPLEIGRKIYDKYSGWSMVKSEFRHSSKGLSTNEIYHIWIEKGNQKKRLKFKNTGDPIARYAEVYSNDESWES